MRAGRRKQGKLAKSTAVMSPSLGHDGVLGDLASSEETRGSSGCREKVIKIPKEVTSGVPLSRGSATLSELCDTPQSLVGVRLIIVLVKQTQHFLF